jgi:hypothetical protein
MLQKLHKFSVEELSSIQTALTNALVTVAADELDLKRLALRGIDPGGKWVGFDRASSRATEPMWVFEFLVDGQEAVIAVAGQEIAQAQARALSLVEARNGARAQLIRSVAVGQDTFFSGNSDDTTGR